MNEKIKKLEEEMEKFYSSSEAYMHQLKSHSLEGYQKYFQKIVKFVPKGSKILEVGCGTGQVANYLSERGYHVTGIDLSPLFINEAKKLGKANFLTMNSTNLLFKDKSFDAVICAESLEHMPNPKKAVEEMVRVLTDNGIAILRFPNRQSKVKNLLIRLTKKPMFEIISPNLDADVAGDDEDLCYVASVSDVIVLLKSKGYKILYSKPFFWPSALIVARKA